MTITGSCLCGGVRFEVDRVVGPFELCHCNRCRKVSGSAFTAMVGGLLVSRLVGQPGSVVWIVCGADARRPRYGRRRSLCSKVAPNRRQTEGGHGTALPLVGYRFRDCRARPAKRPA